MSLLPFLGLALAAAAITASATPWAARWAATRGWVDRPRGRKDHAQPTPYLGGVVVALACTLVPSLVLMAGHLGFTSSGASAWLAEMEVRRASWIWLAIGLWISTAGGLWDDLVALRPLWKLLFQGLAAAAAVWGAGIALSWTPWPWLDALGAWLWIVAAMNAFNWLDNMNGALTGIALGTAVPFFALTYVLEQFAVAGVLAVMIGACLAFLPFNFPRARLFLGDAGSQALGFLFGALTVQASYRGAGTSFDWATWLVPPALLALPLMDLLAVVLSRWWSGAPIAVGDHRHVSFRLAARLGSRERGAVACWVAAFTLAALACALPWCNPVVAALLVGIQWLVFAALGSPFTRAATCSERPAGEGARAD